MLLTYFGNDRDIFDDAFYNSAEGGFDVELLSASSTEVRLRNTATGYTTTLTGTGLAASENPADFAGTLAGIEISSPTGVIASLTGLNWDLPTLYDALEQLYDSDGDGPLMALLSTAPLTVDASQSDSDSTFLLDQVTAPVTYLGGKLVDEITTGNGDDRLFGDGFAGGYAEEASGQVYRLYQATLDRAPDITGFLNWSGRLADGMDLASVIDGFVQSPEFKATYGALGNEAFVTLLYNNVLDRDPDATGLTNWTARLDGGMTRAKVVEGFSQSAEFQAATAADLKEWLRDVDYGSGSIYHDLLHPGSGSNLLAGGIGADVFEFAQSDGGSHRVLDLEPWDYVALEGFGYADAAAALAQMSQDGSDVSFDDQGVSIIFSQTLLAEITDDMILV